MTQPPFAHPHTHAHATPLSFRCWISLPLSFRLALLRLGTVRSRLRNKKERREVSPYLPTATHVRTYARTAGRSVKRSLDVRWISLDGRVRWTVCRPDQTGLDRIGSEGRLKKGGPGLAAHSTTRGRPGGLHAMVGLLARRSVNGRSHTCMQPSSIELPLHSIPTGPQPPIFPLSDRPPPPSLTHTPPC